MKPKFCATISVVERQGVIGAAPAASRMRYPRDLTDSRALPLPWESARTVAVGLQGSFPEQTRSDDTRTTVGRTAPDVTAQT